MSLSDILKLCVIKLNMLMKCSECRKIKFVNIFLHSKSVCLKERLKRVGLMTNGSD